MSFRHDAYSIPMEHHPGPVNMYMGLPVQFPVYTHHQAQEMMMPPYAFPDYGDFMHPGMMLDDFDDSAEISTRPRLTKEQVEILESQFRAHPKPNSQIKKQLATQTKLTLPRVANWFQNRRAKAKQLKKQEEYEMQQSLEADTDGQDLGDTRGGKESSDNDSGQIPGSPTRSSVNVQDSSHSVSASQSPSKSDLVKESWLSLQRALGAAKAAQRQKSQDQDQIAMPPPDIPRPIPLSHNDSPFYAAQTPVAKSSTEWTSQRRSSHGWSTPSAVPNHLGFEFGFDPEPFHVIPEYSSPLREQFVQSPHDWPSQYVNEGRVSVQNDCVGLLSPPLGSTFASSIRRGSGSDELAANFGTFALAGTPPVPQVAMPVEGGTDIASRRKRPRPAALTSASLRSRSYGALSATSPSFRNGPPSGGQLRQVKSTGFGLNARYAGIRKPSIPQRSPLNISSFAEAEALDTLIKQQAATTPASKTPTPADRPASNNVNDMPHISFAAASQCQMAPSEIVSQYRQLSSPPATPFQSEFLVQQGTSMQASLPNAQYASISDFTPPYSAGPLTNSTCSWSDAPLQSPELATFPTGTFMSTLGFNPQDSTFQQWVVPSDNHLEPGSQRKTEFYITEFPGQREEHASVAQQVVPQRPKNYVFSNTVPCDYDL